MNGALLCARPAPPPVPKGFFSGSSWGLRRCPLSKKVSLEPVCLEPKLPHSPPAPIHPIRLLVPLPLGKGATQPSPDCPLTCHSRGNAGARLPATRQAAVCREPIANGLQVSPPSPPRELSEALGSSWLVYCGRFAQALSLSMSCQSHPAGLPYCLGALCSWPAAPASPALDFPPFPQAEAHPVGSIPGQHTESQ